MTRTLLLTGGTGVIGRRVFPALSRDWRVLSATRSKLVTRADFGIAQELVEGLTSDLVARHPPY